MPLIIENLIIFKFNTHIVYILNNLVFKITKAHEFCCICRCFHPYYEHCFHRRNAWTNSISSKKEDSEILMAFHKDFQPDRVLLFGKCSKMAENPLKMLENALSDKSDPVLIRGCGSSKYRVMREI